MAKIDTYKRDNTKTGQIDLSDKVFKAPVNESLIYFAVKHYLAKGRAGSASTKTRDEVRGSGQKVWRQKGTGRARAGTIRNPIWRTGGIVFGPKPRSYDFHLPKKMRHGALRSALSMRLMEDRITVIDELSLDAPKTKEIVEMLKAFSVDDKFLVVDDIKNSNLMLSVRNLPKGKFTGGYGLNVYDILKFKTLLLTKKGVSQIEEVLGK